MSGVIDLGRGAPATGELDAWGRARELAAPVGVTRLADITGLDRLGVPVYNAVVPESADVISVYSGKGVTPKAAMTSAVMEAVERFSGALPARPGIVASADDLRRRRTRHLAVERLALAPSRWCRPNRNAMWIEGTELVSGEPAWMPLTVAGFYVTPPERPPLALSSTNGLAAGFTVATALLQALYEVVERDALTLAQVVAVRLANKVPADKARVLHQCYPRVALSALSGDARTVADAFAAAGVAVHLRDITSDIGIPTMFAAAYDSDLPGASAAHHGIGTHDDWHVAVRRALTELAQSRAVDIGAIREDLVEAHTAVPGWGRHMQRACHIDHTAWPYEMATAAVIPGHGCAMNVDARQAIAATLDLLTRAGLDDAYAVDLSPPGLEAHVVRAIVPGLESWGVDRSRVSARATAAWRTAARTLTGEAAAA